MKKPPTDRTKRVREARDEAKKEIDDYRKTKEEEFKKFESEVNETTTIIINRQQQQNKKFQRSAVYKRKSRKKANHKPSACNTRKTGKSKQHNQGNKQAEDEANKEADARIQEIKEAGTKSQSKVVEDLLKAVLEVKPVAPSAA